MMLISKKISYNTFNILYSIIVPLKDYFETKPQEAPATDAPPVKSVKSELLDFFKDLLIIIVVVIVIRSFFILPFQISGQSMYDSYYNKEFIIVNRFSYLTYESPHRGDVVVFKTHIKNKEYFIKRVIGLPGEKIKISGGKVYIQAVGSKTFQQLDEKYLMQGNYNQTFVRGEDEENVFEVPAKSYFVMGDNRNASTDSRTCFSSCEFGSKSNYIGKSDIVGHVMIDLGYFSFSKLSFFQDELSIPSKPRFFSSPANYSYE